MARIARKTKAKDEKAEAADAADAAACTDRNCPFHGKLRLHGRRFVGTVSSAKMRKTASIVIERTAFIRKYERRERRRSGVKVHNPECISAKEGDKVEAVECRPLSKTKHFVIVKKL